MQTKGDARHDYIRHPRELPLLFRPIPRDIARARLVREEGTFGGLRFESLRNVRPGEVLEITSGVYEETQTFCGVVHWVRPLGRRFEVAVRFTNRDDAYAARMAEQVCYIEAFRRRLSRRTRRTVGVEEAAERWIARHAAAFPGTGE